MPFYIPYIIWGGVGLLFGGAAAGTYRGAIEISDGIADGLRVAVPVVAGSAALYLIMQNQKG